MKCPGQDSRYWKPGAIFEARCPHCDHPVEFFKDDVSRLCRNCGRRFLNPGMDFGCASYCKYAEQCLGNLPPELIAQKESLLKDRVAIEVKKHYGKDFSRIGHATRTARYAEKIGKEEGGELPLLLASSYLYGLRKDFSDPAAKDATIVAKEILRKSGASDELTEAVSRVLACEEEADLTARILHDADLLAGLEERKKREAGCGKGEKFFSRESFRTDAGRSMAEKLPKEGPHPSPDAGE